MNLGAILFGLVVAIIAAIIGWTCGAAAASYHYHTLNETGATLYVGYVAASVAAGAAVIAIWGVYTQRAITRRQTTIQYIASLKADIALQTSISKFIELSRGQKNFAHWADEDQQGAVETLAITAVLNSYELIAVGIQDGIYDYKIIRRYYRNTIMRFWTAAHPFVVALRRRVGVQTIWSEFEKLNGWMDGSKNPGFTLFWCGIL